MSQLSQGAGFPRCRPSFRRASIVTARDVKVAALTAVITLGAAGWMRAQPAVIGSRVFLWDSLKVEQTKVGERRDLVRAPTATLDELEMHITTLKAGEQSHPPHQHAAEELLIIKEGTLDSLVNGETKRVSAGSVIFQASNQPHTIRNVGTRPATYHVIQWLSPGMKK